MFDDAIKNCKNKLYLSFEYGCIFDIIFTNMVYDEVIK